MYSTTEFNRDFWRKHSLIVAEGASVIAGKLGWDADHYFALGLFHDIGKAIDPRPKKHALAGFQWLMDKGLPQHARIAITHDFPDKDLGPAIRSGMLDAREIEMVKSILEGLEYDLADRIVQVCDVTAFPDGFVLMEKRILNAVIRYGQFTETLAQIIMTSYENIRIIDQALGTSVYSVLPGVVENTFGAIEVPLKNGV